MKIFYPCFDAEITMLVLIHVSLKFLAIILHHTVLVRDGFMYMCFAARSKEMPCETLINGCYKPRVNLQQFSSSQLSEQSASPSHSHSVMIQLPSGHVT